MTGYSEDEKKEIRREFSEVVNMTPKELEEWLETEESRSVGWAGGSNKSDSGGEESVGHKSGKRIVELKRKKASDYDEDDYDHMKKVIGYVHRHSKQGGPKDDKAHSRWRYSLMNWGCDPLK
jgi:hypothetical protein